MNTDTKLIPASLLWERIKRIQNGSGLNRDNFPKMIADIAQDKWNEPLFSYGMEYGYILALHDLIDCVDSTRYEHE